MEEILASIRRIIADDDTGEEAKLSELSELSGAKRQTIAAAASQPAQRTLTVPPVPPPRAAAFNALMAHHDAAEAARPDVLNLSKTMTTSAPIVDPEPEAALRSIDASSDVVFSDRSVNAPIEPPLRTVEKASEPAPQAAAPDHGLISSSTMAAVDSSFGSLANTVLGQNARTLEDLVKEMLRPMLKSWLDDNLPGLVDRIVRAEIERISRRR